ncbi:MAG: TonB-dependent receptor plug domain-containing protein [Bacteroidota bacterium]
MNKFKFLVVVLILIFNQLSVGRGKFIQYPSAGDSVNLIEKVYLHVDRENYLAGDDIWFKAYLIDAMDRLLTDHSNNLRVELISPSSKIISKRIIRLEGGLGNGDFKLPSGITSGRYKLRAYTNYMRNFGDQLFFSKEIVVINSADSGEISDRVKYVENKIQISFFPEGGSLFDNVSSIVAFKAVNYLGKGCDVSGKIYSSASELITTFKSSRLGMGSFYLRPKPGLSYYSVTRGADSIDIKTELPAGFSTGVTLSASINLNNELLITTKTNPETLTLVSDHELLLTISIRKEVFKTIPYNIKSPVTSFVIPINDLPDGILMLTLTTMEDLPLSERLIYIEREAPLKIQIETDKRLYSRREPVTLKIAWSEDSTIDREGNVSLAVVNEELTDNTSQFPRNISSWFLLESDVRGTVEDPSYYFDPSNNDRLKDIDLLLRTQGWRDFTWKYDSIYFPPENGFMVSGSLRKDNKNKPIVDSRVSIGIFGSTSTLMRTVPLDSTGRFKLSGIDMTGEAKLIVTGIGKNDHLEGVLTLDSAIYNPAEISDKLSAVSILSENNKSKLKSYYKISEAIKKKYKLSDTITIGEVNIVSERHKDPQTVKVESSRSIYAKPDAELIVSEQMGGYRNVPELMRGKIPGVEVIGPDIKGDYKISIRGAFSFKGPTLPLVLIDGNQATFEDLLLMPVSDIDRIDVLKLVSSTVIFGLRGDKNGQAANGVINLITKAGGVTDVYKPVKYSANLKISGYSISRIFYSPHHLPDSNSDFKPDLRSTLYWKPDINLEGTNEVILNYYNGDNSSLIRIIAEGITSTGIPVTGKAEYEVR